MFFRKLESDLRDGPRVCVAVAGAAGEEIFSSLRLSEKLGITEALLVGEKKAAMEGADRAGMECFSILEAEGDEAAAEKAVEAVRDGTADILMKGRVSTAVLLKAVLSDKTVFSRGKLLSHLAVLEAPDGHILGITDGGMNISPDVDQKRVILESAVEAFRALGISLPKVAVLAAMEKENPKIPESIDAGKLSRLQDSGEISDCIVEGPMALDLAVTPEACRLKNYKGKIQGDANILLAPDISAGNILAKSLVHLGGWRGGGLVVGAGRPIVLLSRSDTAEEKYNSILLAIALYRKPQPLSSSLISQHPI
ncbi:MAG: phosphate butyryltransferase [Spirochaetes bacterium]|nr:MAG: phosphate butyryltransferase [Spirochaetota bacterium]